MKSGKSLAYNNKAKFEYDIKDTYVAGLVLSGPEVKAAKTGNLSLAGSYVKVNADGAYLLNAHIGPYKYAPVEGYEPTQTRKLLLKQIELNEMLGKEKGAVIVPLEVFIGSRNLVKIVIGVGRGRKKADKREYIKKRDDKRDMRKATI